MTLPTLCCPGCGAQLHALTLTCASCNLRYPRHGDVPILLPGATLPPSVPTTADDALKNFFKRWPRFYAVLFAVVGPAFLTGLTSARFVRTLAPDAHILNAGSGSRRIAANCLNVDLLPFHGVDLVADLRALPLPDACMDAVTSEQVLEHVPEPHRAAAEMIRVTKPGGVIHIAIPFIFPWHPSPSDYTRWTYEGLADLFPHCTVVRKGIAAGPCSAFVGFNAAFLATVLSCGFTGLQAVLQYVFLTLLAPVKVLDIVFARLPGAELCAAELWVVFRRD